MPPVHPGLPSEEINLGIAFVGGLVSFASPCVLPLVPTYLTFIAGVSLADLRHGEQGKRVWRRTLAHSVLFVLGFSLVFVLAIGGLVEVVQRLVAGHQAWVYRLAGVIMIVLGLHFSGLVPLRFLEVEKRLELEKKPIGYLGSLLVGVLFAAGWTPCVGPVLGTIVALASASKSSGFLMLSAYSLGLGLPFIAASVALNTFLGSYARVKKHLRTVSLVSGLLLAGIGVLMLGGIFEKILRWLQ